MKPAFYLLAIFLAYAVAGTLDYDIEAGMQAERVAAAGEVRYAAR